MSDKDQKEQLDETRRHELLVASPRRILMTGGERMAWLGQLYGQDLMLHFKPAVTEEWEVQKITALVKEFLEKHMTCDDHPCGCRRRKADLV